MDARMQTASAHARKRTAVPVSIERAADAQHAESLCKANAEAEGQATERYAMIATAAYLRVEKRGFAPGHELEDWLAAEAEVADRLLISLVRGERPGMLPTIAWQTF
jgi:hypothetical protein